MRRRELPREAFLGEMVVGHKNTKVIKPLFPQANYENIRENRGYSGKNVCKLCTKYCKYVLFQIIGNFLANCENFC